MSAPTAVDRLDQPAELAPCERCANPTLLRPGGLCADCIAVIGLHHPDEHQAWRSEVKRRTERAR